MRPDAIRLDPDNAVYHNDLGRALYDQERYEGAEEAQREAVRLNPEHPVFLFNMGTDLYAQGAVRGGGGRLPGRDPARPASTTSSARPFPARIRTLRRRGHA